MTQTPVKYSAGTSRKVKTLQKTIAKHDCKRMLETWITVNDVVNFLEANFSEESCNLLKTQMFY